MHRLRFLHKLELLEGIFLPILAAKPYMSHIWVTRRCNIHCKFCYIREFGKKDPSLREIKKRLDKIRELGCRLTVIMGGEPTLRKDLPEIAAYCDKKGILSYLVTNGTLLNKRLVDKLGKSGLDAISISLDTLNPKKTPLVNYGKYAFNPKDKLALLKYSQDNYDTIAFVAICVTKLNREEVLPIIELAKEYDLAATITAMADPYILHSIRKRRWQPEKDSVLFKTKAELSKLRTVMKRTVEMKRNGLK